MNRKGNLLSKVLVWALILALLVLTYKIWLPLPGTFLLVKDNVGKADCIVPLGGEESSRYKKAVGLYNEDYAKMILLSVPPESKTEPAEFYNFERRMRGLKDISNKEFALNAFQYFGKNGKDIYFTDMTSTSTFDEAVAAKLYMMRHGLRSLILVTSTYHMRRSLLTFKLVFAGTGIKIYYATAKSELYDPYRWWRSEKDVKMVFAEYLYIVYNLMYHFVLGKGTTSFDSC